MRNYENDYEKKTMVLHIISYFAILNVCYVCFQCLWKYSWQAEGQVAPLWFEEKQCHWHA